MRGVRRRLHAVVAFDAPLLQRAAPRHVHEPTLITRQELEGRVLNRRSKEILELLLNGFRDESWKAELRQIETRRRELEALLASGKTEPPLPALHPHMASVFKQRVEQVAAALP